MNKQTPENWQAVSQAFAKVVELSPESRESFLRSLPIEIQKEVQSLLLFHREENDFLENAPTMEISEFSPGDTVSDFKLIEKIGEGSFGTVYRAKQQSLDRDVALKITPNIGNEAQVMAHLEHDGIVRVFSETLDENRQLRFICMQYVPGSNLEKSGIQWADEESILRLGIQLAEALRYAHERGVLHLDVKPSNILIHESGRVFLTDFNVSLSKTRDQTVSLYGGTKHFMPPEQEACLKKVNGATSADLDERTDIFSLGRVLQDVIRRSGLSLSELSPNFRWVVEKCTAARKEDRIQSTNEMIDLLKACIENASIQARLKKQGWYLTTANRFPLLTLSFSILIPHIIAGIINLLYNSMRIVSNLTPIQQSVFERMVPIVNLVIYGVCTILLLRILSPLFRKDPSDMRTLRARLLGASRKVALISALGWTAAALSFPFGIHFLGEPAGPELFIHFFISFFLSAMVASTYSALNSQYFLLRILYPKLWIGATQIRKTATMELSPFLPKIRMNYSLSGTVPLIGAGLMVLVGPETLVGSSYTIYRALLATFIGMGIVGVFYAMNSSRDLTETISTMTE